MSEAPQRFDHIRRWARIGRLLALAGLAAIGVVAGYLFAVDSETLLAESGGGFVQALVGVGLIAAGLFLAAGLIFLWSLVDLGLKIEANSFRVYDVLRDIEGPLEEYREGIRSLSENSQLSDAARAIMHRAKERTALRLAINEEIIRGDWEAAYALVKQLESRHGYKNEAARLREEVDRSRKQAGMDQVHESVEQACSHMAQRDWDRARREMDQLLAEHPGNAEVRDLPKRFRKLRDEHKRRLLKEWDQAVQRNEVDRGIALLKELDQYLTPNEAAALAESARGVFRTKLHNLGVQFSLAVTDHDWQGSLDAAEQIVQEFPNSRMAQEVKQRIHILKERAADAATKPEPTSTPQD